MKATVSEPESWKRIIEIEVPDQEIQSAFDEKLNTYKRDMKLPGFRPGKVPANLIRQRYGSAIRAEIIDSLVQKAFQQACEENSINPVAPAKINNMEAPEGQALKFTVETEVDPKIEITGYNKLKVKPQINKIKEKDIDIAVENFRERFAEYKDVDRPAKKGDFIKLDYLKVVIEGVERSDIKNPNYPVELGGENRIKDFDKGLIGHSKDETIDLDVKFPKDYPDADVAGKEGNFQVKITAVQEKVLPELSEEFLKKLDVTDENDLREKIKQNLEQDETSRAKNEAYNEAIEKLIEENPFDVPPARIQQFIDYMYQEALKYQRKDTPAPDRAEIEEKYRETAVKALKRQRILDYVADKENIKVTQEEVDKEIMQLAQMYNQPFETLKQTFRQNGTTLKIRSDLREQKTLDYLIGEYTPQTAE
ncbi:MAG: trigger factor [Fibrobacter sp.]|nr:trigger factor [Fibrobacter sp.]